MSKFGNITELPSGKYRARYGYKGKTYTAPKTFYTKTDAGSWLRSQEKLIEFGEWVPPKQQAARDKARQLTLGDWLEQWLQIKAPGWKESTLQTYQKALDRRIFEVEGEAALLQDVPLRVLQRRDLAAWWDAITMQYGKQRINTAAYQLLKAALNAAVERELIDVNPATLSGTGRPRAKRKELPRVEDMRAILEAMPPRHRIVTALTFFHGMRIGEVLALRRKDIELVNGRYRVYVRGSAYRKAGVGMVRLDTPKTDAGNRVVPVFPQYAELVSEHLKRWVGDSPDAMVCTTETGKVLMDTSYRSRLKTAKKNAGLEHLEVSSHYGRVWLITALVEAGLTIPAIGEILGQRDLKTITEVYMRTSDARKQEALAKVNDLL